MELRSWLLALPVGLCLAVVPVHGQILTALTSAATGDKRPATTHTIDVSHPSYNNGAPAPRQLTVIRDEDGEPLECFMDVESVACGDGSCSIVTVRMVWDALGTYSRYEFPLGGRLTKKGHNTFTLADSQKLHSLLADPASPLRHLTNKQVSAPGDAIADVDATTGATPAAIRQAVVQGAVYTCYTLWHWANGDTTEEIREITGKTCSAGWLFQCVDSGPERFAVFAMEKLALRGIHDKATLEAILRRAKEGSGKSVKACLRYLEHMATVAGPEIHYHGVERLFATANDHTRVLYIASLSEAPLDAPDGYWDRLSSWLPRLDTYYPMHLLLKLMEKRNPRSAEVTKQAVSVIDNENFLIARRAFWYLEKQDLTETQQQAIAAFREKYAGRL